MAGYLVTAVIIVLLICITCILGKVVSETSREDRERFETAQLILRKVLNYEALTDRDYELLEKLIK